MQPETDKTRLIELIRTEHSFAERTIALMRTEWMLEPNVVGWWSVKDTLAHLTAWMRRVLAWVEAYHRGDIPAIPGEGYTWDDVDRLNDDTSAQDKQRSLEEVLVGFRNAHLEILALIDSLSDEDLFDRDYNGHQGIWRLISENTHEHYVEHLVPVREWLAKRVPGHGGTQP